MDSAIAFEPSIRSQISHDLRLPITGILGLIYCLHATTKLTTQQKEYLEDIRKSANRLLDLEPKLHELVSNNKNSSS